MKDAGCVLRLQMLFINFPFSLVSVAKCDVDLSF